MPTWFGRSLGHAAYSSCRVLPVARARTRSPRPRLRALGSPPPADLLVAALGGRPRCRVALEAFASAAEADLGLLGLLNSVSVVVGPVVRILFPPPASRPDRCHKSKLKLAKAGRNILSLNHRLDFTWKHYATEDGFRAFGWPTRCRGEGSSRSCSKVGLDSTRTASASSFSAVFNRASQTHGVPARSANSRYHSARFRNSTESGIMLSRFRGQRAS